MNPRILAWPVGLAGSFMAHGAIIAGLVSLLAPEPVADQPRPETRLDVQAYALERAQADAASAAAEPADETRADATSATVGGIRRARAEAAQPDAQTAAPAEVDARPLSGADPDSQVLAQARPPANTLPNVTVSPPQAAVAAPDTPQQAEQSSAPAQALDETEAPAASAMAAVPAFSGLSASAPANTRLPDSAPSVSVTSALPPPALPARTDVPAPSVIDQVRPALAIAQTAEATANGLPAARPQPTGLEPSQTPVDIAAAALPDTLRVIDTGPTGTPAAIAALLPDPAASAQPAAAQAVASTPSVQAAAPALGQATPAVAGSARMDTAPALSAVARPAQPTDAPANPLPPGPVQAAPAPRATVDPELALATRTEAEPADTAPATGLPVPPSPPDATAIRAALAFSGGDGDIDPLSLAAFQSFVAPDALPEASSLLRDGLQGILAAIPCSRLQLAFDPDTASLRVDGHIPDNAMRAEILGVLQQEMGADIGVSDNMAVLPRPQCDSLAGIGNVGLPQSTDQNTNPLLLGDTLHARALDFVAGDLIYFDLTAPDYDAYVYVDYFDANGNVLHISPNDSVPLIFAPAESTFRVGADSADDTDSLRLFVQAPFGQEITVAFASSVPLYDALRPIVEPAAPYLEWLRRRVAAARAENPDFKGEWVYFFVTTAAE